VTWGEQTKDAMGKWKLIVVPPEEDDLAALEGHETTAGGDSTGAVGERSTLIKDPQFAGTMRGISICDF